MTKTKNEEARNFRHLAALPGSLLVRTLLFCYYSLRESYRQEATGVHVPDPHSVMELKRASPHCRSEQNHGGSIRGIPFSATIVAEPGSLFGLLRRGFHRRQTNLLLTVVIQRNFWVFVDGNVQVFGEDLFLRNLCERLAQRCSQPCEPHLHKSSK